jgi:hypothetical protein
MRGFALNKGFEGKGPQRSLSPRQAVTEAISEVSDARGRPEAGTCAPDDVARAAGSPDLAERICAEIDEKLRPL